MCEFCHIDAEPFAEAVLQGVHLNLELNNARPSLAYYAIIGALVRLLKANKNATIHGEPITDDAILSLITDDFIYLNEILVETPTKAAH
jgi:hypothetical protein